MDETRLFASYWPADTTRAILDVSIGRVLAAAVNEVPDRTALIEIVPASMQSAVGAPHVNRRWTYAQLQDDARRCASWLLRRFETGDRICVWALTSPSGSSCNTAPHSLACSL